MTKQFLLTLTCILVTCFCSNLFAQCPSGELEVFIEINTDDYGYELYWEMTPNGDPCGTNTIGSGGSNVVGCNGAAVQVQNTNVGYGNNITITEGPYCLAEGSLMDLHWIDDWGDGGGNFTIIISGFPVYNFLGTTASETWTFEVANPPAYDARLLNVNLLPYLPIASYPVGGEVSNQGVEIINSLDISYSVNGGNTITDNLTGLNIMPFENTQIESTIPWDADMAGNYTVEVSVSNINGNTDQNPGDNSQSISLEVGAAVPNLIDSYLAPNANPIQFEISTASDGLDTPRDLDFHPVLSNYELWVINTETEASGGTTTKYSNAGQVGQTALNQQDGNAWHFMSLPTAIAFSDNGNFATSPGVFDANHQGTSSAFTGPSLWDSNPSVYAQPSGGNGSHIDMLHESPHAMGIAHEKDNVFWLYDGYSKDIVRYDFAADHGPGNGFHGDAIIRRYTTGLNLEPDPTYHVVSHVVLDKSTGWLYIADTGNDRILRLDINTGAVSGNTPVYGQNEGLVEYSDMMNFTFEEVPTTNLDQVSGIEVFNDRLLASDYGTGDIIIYDISANPVTEMGRISTGAQGIMGLKVGPDGKIWYVDAEAEKVFRIDGNLGEPVGITNLNQLQANIYPNPIKESINIQLETVENVSLSISDISGKVLYTNLYESVNSIQLNPNLQAGIYFLELETSSAFKSQKIVIE